MCFRVLSASSGAALPYMPKNIAVPSMPPIWRKVCRMATPTPKFSDDMSVTAAALIMLIANPQVPMPARATPGKKFVQ